MPSQGVDPSDPYANVKIDVAKIAEVTRKANEKKPYDEKTEEEKKNINYKGAVTGKKSALKKAGSILSDSDDDIKPKRGVTFGKEIIHDIERANEEDDYSGEKVKRSPR